MPQLKQTVFVVDDDKAMRDILSLMISSAGIPVVTYASAHDFLAGYTNARPGCLLLDVNMPAMNGLDLQQALIDCHVRLPVILMSGSGDVPTVVRGVSAGAVDFLEKPFRSQALLDRIRRAFEIQARQTQELELTQSCSNRFSTLTPRERDVMQLLCVGKSGKEMAAELGISYKTIEKFRGKVMLKMEANSIVELVRMADSLNCFPASLPVSHPTHE